MIAGNMVFEITLCKTVLPFLTETKIDLRYQTISKKIPASQLSVGQKLVRYEQAPSSVKIQISRLNNPDTTLPPWACMDKCVVIDNCSSWTIIVKVVYEAEKMNGDSWETNSKN